MEEPYRDKILDKVKSLILHIIETRQEVWSREYCAKPHWYSPSPYSPLFPLIKKQVISCLENEIFTQDIEGNFLLNWDAVLEENEWKSTVNMEALKILKNHSMIE